MQEGAEMQTTAEGWQEVADTCAVGGSQDPAGGPHAVAGLSQVAVMTTLPADDARRRPVPRDPLTYPHD
jgi:hypothetical protein